MIFQPRTAHVWHYVKRNFNNNVILSPKYEIKMTLRSSGVKHVGSFVAFDRVFLCSGIFSASVQCVHTN